MSRSTTSALAAAHLDATRAEHSLAPYETSSVAPSALVRRVAMR
jgi:hypothetical protein